MTPRRATVADAAKLSLLGAATFLESFADDHDWNEVAHYIAREHSADWYRARLTEPGVAAWLIEEAVGCPIGYAMIIPATLPGSAPDDVELKRIYVLSRWHGRGLGAALYAAIETEARAMGAERLVLSVYEHNLSAQAFYRARGYTEIGRWLFEGFATSEDLVWVKPLDGGRVEAGGTTGNQ